MVTYIQNEDLADHIDEYDVILVGTNTYCTMSQGFQLKVMLDYPSVMDDNMKTKYGDKRKLGMILDSKVNEKLTFCLCFITHSYNFRPDITSEYLDYDALENCLKLINVLHKGKHIASTLLGTSKFDGNGDVTKVKSMLENICKDVDITVYCYSQLSRNEGLKKQYKLEQKVKKKDPDLYYKMVRERKAKAEERFKKNKHRRY